MIRVPFGLRCREGAQGTTPRMGVLNTTRTKGAHPSAGGGCKIHSHVTVGTVSLWSRRSDGLNALTYRVSKGRGKNEGRYLYIPLETESAMEIEAQSSGNLRKEVLETV